MTMSVTCPECAAPMSELFGNTGHAGCFTCGHAITDAFNQPSVGTPKGTTMSTSVKTNDRLAMPGEWTGTIVSITHGGSVIVEIDDSRFDEMIFDIDAQLAAGKLVLI